MGGHVEFGANTLTQQESASIAKVRSEEAMTTRQCIEAKSDICRLASGKRFSIDNFEQLTDELLITEVVHRTTHTVLTGGRADEDLYRNEIKAIRNTHTYRPPRRALRPRISGVVTGTVVGIGSSSTIGTPSQPDVPVGAIDESGRYLVQLHLDTPGRDITHQGDVDLTSGQHALASLPIRMLQAAARITECTSLREGVEVMVVFVNGDPDRPVIVAQYRTKPQCRHDRQRQHVDHPHADRIVMEFSDG